MFSRKYITSIRVHVFFSQLCWFTGAYHLRRTVAETVWQICDLEHLTNLNDSLEASFYRGPNSPENSPFQINRETFVSWKTGEKTTKKPMKVPKNWERNFPKYKKWKKKHRLPGNSLCSNDREWKGHEVNHLGFWLILQKKTPKILSMPPKGATFSFKRPSSGVATCPLHTRSLLGFPDHTCHFATAHPHNLQVSVRYLVNQTKTKRRNEPNRTSGWHEAYGEWKSDW